MEAAILSNDLEALRSFTVVNTVLRVNTWISAVTLWKYKNEGNHLKKRALTLIPKMQLQ
jgi:hypothetical protein